MKNSLKYFFATIIAIVILASCTNNDVNNPIMINNHQESLEQYIVVINDNAPQQQAISSNNSGSIIEKLLISHNIETKNIIAIYDKVFNGFCATLTSTQVKDLKTDSRIAIIEKDQPVYLQGFVEKDNKHSNKILAQTTAWGINAVGGSVNATTSTGVAWIIDTGIDLTHPDLNVNSSLGANFVPTGSDALTLNDLHGHGTHISGIIGAKNNTIGVIGVCAGATVIPIKVFNYLGSSTMSRIISGLNFVANNLVSGKINVVNMSLGGSSNALLDSAVIALSNAGAYVVIAAGNSNSNSNNYSPAKVNGTRITTVSAYGSNGNFASFSNWANAPIDYSAPGVSIYSTYKNNGYGTMSGTSMACPHVVGILLANNGTVSTNATVNNDPDGTPDFKAIR